MYALREESGMLTAEAADALSKKKVFHFQKCAITIKEAMICCFMQT
jgi:hypothetical protein